jgi:hypothetical protein
MIYLCAGLYAEGSSDYDFLLPLISRLLDTVGARLFPSECEVAETTDRSARRAPRPTLTPLAFVRAAFEAVLMASPA